MQRADCTGAVNSACGRGCPLALHWGRVSLISMSAAEIIEQIKVLPETDKAEVVAFVRKIDQSQMHSASLRHHPKMSFEEAASLVFRENAELFRRLAQ